MSFPTSPSEAPAQPVAATRIVALDIIRGFALCGILFANIQPIANVDPRATTGPGGAEYAWLGLFFEHRFFPIFSLLFGIGFALLLRSAGNRVANPRLVLLRRLLVLLVVGVAHFFLLWQGDILSTYAVIGIAVLLPSSWLPAWAVTALGGALMVTAIAINDDRFVLVAALFLIGSALVRHGVVDRIERSVLVPVALGLVAALTATVLWATGHFGLTTSGLLFAMIYVCTLLLLLKTPLRQALQVVFAPLGRMALTNYLTATVLVLAAGRIPHGRPETWSSTTLLLIAAGVLALQWVWSTLWLRHHRFGPLEYLWRWATWLHKP